MSRKMTITASETIDEATLKAICRAIIKKTDNRQGITCKRTKADTVIVENCESNNKLEVADVIRKRCPRHFVIHIS